MTRRTLKLERLALPITAILCLATAARAEPKVKLGIDALRDSNFAILAGKRVGLVVNPASVDGARRPTAMVLKDAPGVNLVALFGPEHGVWGDEYAGDKVGDNVDPMTGVRAYSLYGKTRKPSKAVLDTLDVVVFDLQDIGARSYTYISSMKVLVEACAELDKPLVILDRPNPLGGERIEGSNVAGKPFESFVSFLNVPYLHGMTMGELAQMTRDEIAPSYDKLTVVPMSGWTRDMTWADTGLDWVMTSPHVPHVSSIAGYAATGVMGELYQMSNGVGYTLPFEIVGSPATDGVALAARLNELWPGHPGVYFRPTRFKPFYATNKGEVCGGVQVHLDPKTAPSLVEINYRLVEALGGPAMMKNADAKPKDAATVPNTAGAINVAGRRAMFDKVTGTDAAGDVLAAGGDLAPLFATWRAECEAFRRSRARHLLYR